MQDKLTNEERRALEKILDRDDVQEGKESTVDQLVRKVKEAHTDMEFHEAEAWVSGYFADAIQGDPPFIVFAVITANDTTREMGLVGRRVPDGFIIRRSIDVEKFIAFYIDVILDEAHESGEEIFWAIVEKSKEVEGRELHPELNFFIATVDGERKVEAWTHDIQ